MSWQSQGIAILAASLARPFALAAAAWLILRVLKIRHPASQHAVWTAVLIGMFLLPFLSSMAPHWKMPLPARPWKHDDATQSASRPAAITSSEQHDSFSRQIKYASETSTAKPAAGSAWPAGLTSGSPSMATLILWCYLAGLFSMLMYRAAGLALVWRVVSRSRPLRAPRLRESGDVLAPVAVGVLRPTVILPAGWRSWTAHTRRVVLLHEFAHLRRHDGLVSALARLVKCLFWFHPLAWWVSRKISDLAELACDAVVLEKMNDPAGYSRILLEFADAVNRAGYRVTLPGLAMAAGSGMSKRIDRVFELSSGTPRKLARPGLLLASMGVPVMCLAATVGLAEHNAPSLLPSAPSARPAALLQLAPAAPTQPVVGSVTAPQLLAQSKRVATPERGPVYMNGLGNVAAFYTVRVKSRIDGQLMSVNFKEGDLVQAGQVLASIDPRPYQIQVAMARGQLATDQAALNNARVDLDRYQKLLAQNAIPKEQLESPIAAVAQLEGRMKLDQANVDRAELELSYAQVTAPIAGIAGLRLVDPGNIVRATDVTGILIITQLQPIAVLFSIPEDSLPQVRARLREAPSPAVEAWNRDNTVKIATGRLTAVDNQIDPESGTAKLKAVFDNQDGALFPNEFVNVRMLIRNQ